LIIVEESAGKSIDNLLTEADSLIRETLPYFQTTLKKNKINISNNVENITINPVIKTKPLKSQYNDTKKVVFNLKNNSHRVKVPDKHIQMSTINGLYLKLMYDISHIHISTSIFYLVIE